MQQQIADTVDEEWLKPLEPVHVVRSNQQKVVTMIQSLTGDTQPLQMTDGFRTRLWAASCRGAPVRLDVHDGGHGLPRGWTARAFAFFEAARQSN